MNDSGQDSIEKALTEIGALQAEAFPALRRFAQSRTQAPMERCELCGTALDEAHQHLLDRKSRQIACSCDACAIVFCGQGGRFLRIPRRIRRVEARTFTDLEWEAMALPINLAFFLREADGRMAAMYPSPAGAIESSIDLNSLPEGHAIKARLQILEPEVEALIVNRIGDEHLSYVVPLDECYRLVGIVKTRWRGLSGGADVWAGIKDFFQQLNARAVEVSPQVQHA
jgi:hypothetical protein